MYVTNSASSAVSVIDSSTNTVIETIPVDNSPTAIEYNPSNDNIYTISANFNAITIIDSSTNIVVKTVQAGTHTVAIEYNPSNDNICGKSGITVRHNNR